jgi:hypothetical protein
MGSEAVWALGGAPGFAKQAVDIGPKHRAGMIEAKERVKALLFELPLPKASPSSSGIGSVPGFGKVVSYVRGIVRVLVRLDHHLLYNQLS